MFIRVKCAHLHCASLLSPVPCLQTVGDGILPTALAGQALRFIFQMGKPRLIKLPLETWSVLAWGWEF